MRHLALSYGVEAIYMPEKANGQAYYFAAFGVNCWMMVS